MAKANTRQVNSKGARASKGEMRELLKQATTTFRWAFVFSFASNVLLLSLPMYSLQVMDRVMSSGNLNTLLMLSILTVGCFLFNTFFTALKNAVLGYIGDWLQLTLSPRLMGIAVENAAIGVHVNASQFQRELANIRNFITGQPLATLMDAPFSIVFLLVIYMINPVLGVVTLAGAVILLIFGVVIEYSTKKPVDESNTLMNKSMQFADSSTRNAEAVEAMGMLPTLLHQWENESRKIQNLGNIAQGRSNVLNSLSRLLRMLMQIAITGIGAWLALYNEITMGHVIAASIISGRALAPFEAAIGLWKQWIITRDSYQKLESLLSDIPRVRGTMAMPAPGGKLKVEGLVYSPPRSNTAILKAINFELNAHESLGLIGPSAAGKSTLARLLMGILPATMGSVRLDGVDIFHWNRADLGQYVGYLPQDVELFYGTIKDNIARMQPDADPAKVIAAAQFAGCHEMILRLPQGYETEFSQHMMSLSPGQRQRIGLARALYNNPSFVVLDEPNSNLDGEGEVALQQAILRMKQAGITFVLVAHKPSIVGHVDKILMLENGMMKDFGPRDTVLKKYTRPLNSPAAAVPPSGLQQDATGTA